MAGLKDIKRRIVTVKKTKQITAAMKLVAGAKLKRATDAATGARPYQARLAEVLKRVAAASGESEEPLLKPHETVKRILVVVITSDRGLCGGFNNNLLRRTNEFLKGKARAGLEVEVVVFGRRGADFLAGRGYALAARTVDWAKKDKMEIVRPIADRMVSGYVDGAYDEVYLASNKFVSTLVQEPTFDRMLPFNLEGVTESAGGGHRYEPGPDEILGALLPLYIRTLILQKFLETEAGEHAARMTAMDNATRNASDLIGSLTLAYNRARQAAITTELIEIVSGASAL